MNTDVRISQNFNYIESMTIFKFGCIFPFIKGWVGGGVKLVAAKEIRQQLFFFT